MFGEVLWECAIWSLLCVELREELDFALDGVAKSTKRTPAHQYQVREMVKTSLCINLTRAIDSRGSMCWLCRKPKWKTMEDLLHPAHFQDSNLGNAGEVGGTFERGANFRHLG